MSSTRLLLGHRGARLPQVPENTIAAFDLALAAGCDGFEFDLRCARDGHLIVFHDAHVCGLEIAVAGLGELQVRWQEREWRRFARKEDLRIPVLEEVLEKYSQAFLDIELKVPGMEECVRAALKENAPASSYVVSSFLPEVLLKMAELDSDIPLGLISDRSEDLQQWRELPVTYVFPQQKLVNPALIAELHSAGKKVIVWTVNRESDMRRLAEWEVDGLVSDDPGLLCRVLAIQDDW